ncbi:TonB-dependent receptor [Sphingomicrobium lutaoense]|uniref:Iron complex outermembrane receptor protein n=1 Tax=Sphingomicrobium lutaoense TaxID=515949 RepID=A0A839YVU3_9SPHN|nr:TonB-dependent receptor [Sphingomicrobium lutaoense]MBB3763146.1 iron complex outermembrane receptor protein [Sphingomicrobium lutaoense]
MKRTGLMTRMTATSSAVAMGLVLAAAGAAPAFAQDTQDVQDDSGEEANPNVDANDPGQNEADRAIIISGFRASLESAVGTKKDQDLVIESISAEDIGKLPDASIGESIARLPGVTSQRLNGRSNVIAIRGFGPDFSTTLLNGREQTSTGDNRGVEFDQYPSEIVNQVVIYKAPSADLIGQGLVGTVDIRTVRPLDFGKQVFAIGARGSYADIGKLNSGSEELGWRANATFIDQFADDRVGVSLAVAYVDEPYHNQEFNAWGYQPISSAFFFPDDPRGGDTLIPGGSKSFVTSTGLKRLGVNSTIQVEASDDIMVTLDGFYSNFDDDQIKRGIELPIAGWFGTTGDPSTYGITDGFYTSGTLENVQGVVRNDIFSRKADLYSGGLNINWDPGNGWSAFVDFGYSRTDREELSIESYSGTGFNWDSPFSSDDDFAAGDLTDTMGFTLSETGLFFSPTLDYSDPSIIRLTDPLGWGGGTRTQAGYYNNRIVEDELKQYRAELAKEFDHDFFGGLKAGVAYTDRDKSLVPDEFFVTLGLDGMGNYIREVDIPQQYLQSPTNLAYLGLGPMVSYDPRELIRDGVLVLEPNLSNDIPAKAFTVTEDIVSAYIQADIDGELGAVDLTGNLGVQMVWTDQASSGIAFLNGTQVDVEAGDDYAHLLPSLNLAARLPGDYVIRFSARKEIMRPRLDDLRVAIGYGVSTTGQFVEQFGGPYLEGGGGNPQLRPYEANSVDLTFEKYFGSSGYVALQAFYKDIANYISDDVVTDFDYSGFPLPAGVQPVSLTGVLFTKNNTGSGELYGIEAAGTLPFEIFSPALEGFGVTGGVSVVESEVKRADGVSEAIPGYSKWVANGTAYFERWGFNARGSVRHRTTFLGDFTGFGGSPTRRQALEETIVDAQIGYEFQPGSTLEGLSLYLQGQNLTDERFASVADTSNPLSVIDYQIYGRRFLAGFTYKF